MMHSFNWNYFRYTLIAIVMIAVTLAIAIYSPTAHGSDQELKKLSNFVQGTKINPVAMQMFREGRDFIEAQNWAKAAEKFGGFIKLYPRDKDLDAALYWYGYALHKQGIKDEAAKPLIRLIDNYPGST